MNSRPRITVHFNGDWLIALVIAVFGLPLFLYVSLASRAATEAIEWGTVALTGTLY